MPLVSRLPLAFEAKSERFPVVTLGGGEVVEILGGGAYEEQPELEPEP